MRSDNNRPVRTEVVLTVTLPAPVPANRHATHQTSTTVDYHTTLITDSMTYSDA
jgi:hypothetical protein